MLQNRRILIAVIIVSSLLVSFCNNNYRMPAIDQQLSGNKAAGFAVMELFTSEGCSSCPAADEAVAELAKQYPDDLYVLSFHVDYWDRLGWKDKFSKAEFTNRQREYVRQFRLESMYTPQVVVNGKKEFVGSDKVKLQAVTKDALSKAVKDSITITASVNSSNEVSIDYKTSATDKSTIINVALVQKQATTEVKRGENGGRSLHHINIVREYKTMTSKIGNIIFKLPPDLELSNANVTAYQQQTDGTIVAVNCVAIKK